MRALYQTIAREGHPREAAQVDALAVVRVANGDVFVLAQSLANPTIIAQADQTNGAGWFNGDDAVVLRKGTTIIDVIGQTASGDRPK